MTIKFLAVDLLSELVNNFNKDSIKIIELKD